MKNLRLRQESYLQPRATKGYAGVLVDTGIFHLDEIFDYRVPEDLASEISIGSRVQVSFRGTKRDGIVYELRAEPATAGRTLWIEKILSPIPVISQRTIDLVEEVARHWGSPRHDIWRCALPARIIAAERALPEAPASRASITPIKRPTKPVTYLLLPPHDSYPQLLAKTAATYLGQGNVLLIVPDDKDIAIFLSHAPVTNVINLGSHLTKSERYRNYLLLQKATNSVVIGNRSAILANVPNLAAIIVHRENSENHYEQRSPGWNTRDVAIIRARQEKAPIIFTGYGPSSEMALTIEEGRVEAPLARRRFHLSSCPPEMGELISSRCIPQVRSALKKGSVLFLVPRKGYASGLVCSRCRNVAHHSCGGVLLRTSMNGPMTCSSCDGAVERIQCHWCSHDVFSITGRGSGRIVEEIGKAFPSTPIKESTAEQMITDLETFSGIVIATSGSIPYSATGYGGVFILEGERFLAGIDVRSAERAVDAFFAAAAVVQKDGAVGVSLHPNNPVVTAMARWNPMQVLRTMLSERVESGLPPYFSTIVIQGQVSELPLLESGLRKAQMDGRLPQGVRIFLSRDQLYLVAPRSERPAVIEFLFQLQRRRSTSGKKLLGIRIDPYSLNSR